MREMLPIPSEAYTSPAFDEVFDEIREDLPDGFAFSVIPVGNRQVAVITNDRNLAQEIIDKVIVRHDLAALSFHAALKDAENFATRARAALEDEHEGDFRDNVRKLAEIANRLRNVAEKM